MASTDRLKKRAHERRWYAKAKAAQSEAWRHRKEAARLRATKYRQKRKAYSRRLQAEDPARANGYTRKYRLKKLEIKAGRKKPTACEICASNKAKIHFDHCHQTGVFRGWICINCNAILGHAKDSADHLRKVITYLER